jgi:outer membrane murein-binding lipoprotein Lpp
VEAVIGLIGAVIGGVLVLLGDLTRRRRDELREYTNRLNASATELAVQFGRLVAQIRDAQLRNDDVNKLRHLRPDRYEATVRFFMTPGADTLRESATAMIRAYQALVEERHEDSNFEGGFRTYFAAEQQFEAQVRKLTDLRRGRRNTRPKPPAVQDRSSRDERLPLR